MAEKHRRMLSKASGRQTDQVTLIRPLRKFLHRLAEDITKDDLHGMSFILGIYDEKEFLNPIIFFKSLIKNKGLAEDNLSGFSELLSEIGRKDLSEKVNKFSEKGEKQWSLPPAVHMRLKSEVSSGSKKNNFSLVEDPEFGLEAKERENDRNLEEDGEERKTIPAEFPHKINFREQFVSTLKKKQLTLYNYQKELAKPGLEGRNSIICAPTGSGKTLTAGFICEELRLKARARGKPFKALFVVCIRNLIQQQAEALSWIVTNDNGSSSEEPVGGIRETINLSDFMKNHVVVVLTAQILINGLQNKEVKLSDLDLIIIDECHHTTLKHPYNMIMLEYLKSKMENPSVKLPQIIGLTASLGVGPSDDPVGHYIKLCANLHCGSITHVKENVEELLTHSPKPDKSQIMAVEARDPDCHFSQVMKNMMTAIEQMVSFPLKTGRQPEGTQQYENWVVSQMQEAEKLGLQETITGTEALWKLNIALMIYDDLRAKDAKRLLDAFFMQDYLAQDPIKIALEIHQMYTKVSPDLEKIVKDEKIDDNPKLKILCNLLTDLYNADGDTRGILLTRTRYSVEALNECIKEIPQLKNVAFPAKLVGQGRKEGSMTDVQQENTIRLFRLGRDDSNGCNLLVATDVAQEGLDLPKCNFVIRYNFVSNEIGSVQARGRARAPNSKCFLIVNRDSENEKREFENLEKEHKMMAALNEVNNLGPDYLGNKIQSEQDLIWQKYQQTKMEKETFSHLLDPAKVFIYCRSCQSMLCNATDMRRRMQNYICVAKDLEEKIFVRKNSKPNEYRYDLQIGVSYCKNSGCEKQLGPQVKYKQGSRRIGFVFGNKNVVWKLDGEDEYQKIKQWSKVPFIIEEETLLP